MAKSRTKPVALASSAEETGVSSTTTPFPLFSANTVLSRVHPGDRAQGCSHALVQQTPKACSQIHGAPFLLRRNVYLGVLTSICFGFAQYRLFLFHAPNTNGALKSKKPLTVRHFLTSERLKCQEVACEYCQGLLIERQSADFRNV